MEDRGADPRGGPHAADPTRHTRPRPADPSQTGAGLRVGGAHRARGQDSHRQDPPHPRGRGGLASPPAR